MTGSSPRGQIPAHGGGSSSAGCHVGAGAGMLLHGIKSALCFFFLSLSLLFRLLPGLRSKSWADWKTRGTRCPWGGAYHRCAPSGQRICPSQEWGVSVACLRLTRPCPCLLRLRSVKIEQGKVNDQANTLADLAKVSNWQCWGEG